MIEILKENKEIWDLFTRKEEYTPAFTDQYTRFPSYLSKYKDIFEPKVSKFLLENGFEPGYPEGKKFAVCLTHDIDILFPSMAETFYFTTKLLMSNQKKDANRVLFSRLNKKLNLFYNFRQIIELEKKYNSKSSFYFLVQDQKDKEYGYDVEDLKEELNYIKDSGWEVGLHGSHASYNNLEDIKLRKQKLEKILGKKIIGYRNHFLRFTVPNTWQLLKDAGFKYDTTLGYWDCSGFRNGTCHPFKPFNLNSNKEIDIIELSLNVMDISLFSSFINGNPMELSPENAWGLIKSLIDTVESYSGIITILWHNTSMFGNGLELYEKVLKYCYEKNAWITSGEDICNWCLCNNENLVCGQNKL
jgi:peptidoglycan/xylan/chitin deacetylase (PgdA/CDA1 family)